MLVLLVGSVADEVAALWQALDELKLDWDVACVSDVSSALALIAVRPVDVAVVSERSAIAANALFERIRTRYPRIVRLLLLDTSDEREAARALEQAHRLLHRPLRGRELVENVANIHQVQALLDSERIRRLVGQIGSLPPPPTLYLELRRMLGEDAAEAATLARVIGSDPAIAAKVLRVCNSAYFTGGRSVADVRNAVVRLGSDTLRRVVLVTEVFAAAPGASAHEREALRERALHASRLAMHLFGDNANADLIATASLLAETGMLLPGVARDDSDTTRPGYAEAGAYLLGLWGLPMPIVEGVAHHLAPARNGHGAFWICGAVHVVHALANGGGIDQGYLESAGMLDLLPRWRRMASGLQAA